MPPDASVFYRGLGLAICAFPHTRGFGIQISLGRTTIVSAFYHDAVYSFASFGRNEICIALKEDVWEAGPEVGAVDGRMSRRPRDVNVLTARAV